jgi:uncharacterized protein (TIGR02171 family)
MFACAWKIRWVDRLKAPLVLVGLAASAQFLIACGDREGGADPVDPIGVGGMRLIRAAGKSFQQGSSGPWAAPNESPPVRNAFTNDFHLDTTEVTQGQFLKVMGYDPVRDSGAFGKGDAYPAYNISWFDAILFCNARGRLSGLDTVYAYNGLKRSAGGRVYDIEGLKVRLDVRGVRLPTEAEWEFAARADGEGEFPWGGLADSALARGYAWYSGNSQVSTHPVAGLKPNAFGLYDMAGNVMEWVNDWKGKYPATGGTDFAGARDPGPEADAPVKGGAFKYGLRELRPSNRSATYTTVRSATAEYVGFRCALGAIAKPRYSTLDGNWSETDPVRLDVTRLENLVEGRPARLVFVNATQNVRHLVFVDYLRTPPRLREFGDAADVFYPVISPDGNWVAYGSRLEGAVNGSTVSIRSLVDSVSPVHEIGPGFIPRWWVDPTSRDTFLVYTNSAADNTQPQWAETRTLLQKIVNGSPVGSPETLAEGGFHDGRSSDGRWLATGFRTLKVRDGVTGTSRTLFTAPQNGKPASDTSQVCNVSIAPDSTGRTLFLDFGFEGTSGITGSFYGIHQVAFLADALGKVERWFTAPRTEAGWQDLEWSNAAGFAVSGATDDADRHGRLYLLNLKDGSATHLASGTWLATPGLWLGPVPDSLPATDLDLDSLGHYNDPATEAEQVQFSGRMAMFWKRHNNLELIFTGSSHVLGGVAPARITKYQTFNMGYSANGWLGQEEWVRNYAMNHCPNLKVMIMEAFPGWLHYPGGDFTWVAKMGNTLGVRYDRSHGFWKDGLPLRFEAMVARAPNPNTYDWDTLGTAPVETVNWGGDPVTPIESEWGLELPEYQENMKRIEALAVDLAARKIHLVLVNYPTNPAFKGNAYYGPYGPKLPIATAIIRRFRAMETLSPYIHFYDANDFNNHDYTDADANNSGHLSTAGAIKLTTRLDSLVNTFH